MQSLHSQIPNILQQYGFSYQEFRIAAVGSGYIHLTYALTADKKFILQRVNKNVFKDPEAIASNLDAAADYLNKHYPDYLFLKAIPTRQGKNMAYDEEGYPWRIFPFFENTYTIEYLYHR
jgi:hypothetical protein